MQSKPIWVGLVLGIVLWAFACGESVAAISASNADARTLHTVDDYLATVPIDAMSVEERRKLLANPDINETNDSLSGKTGVYDLSYSFRSNGVMLKAVLKVFTDKASARVGADQFLLGARSAIEKGGSKFVPILGLENWYPGSQYFALTQDGRPYGNFFVMISGDNIYILSNAGAGYFDNAAGVREFLGSKADKILNFRPVFAPGKADAVLNDLDHRAKLAESRNLGIGAGLAIFNAAGWFLGYGLAWLTNWLGRRRWLSPDWMGVLGVASVAAFFLWIALLTIQARAEAGYPLEPIDEGQLIGRALGPALFVLFIVWIVRSTRSAALGKSSK